MGSLLTNFRIFETNQFKDDLEQDFRGIQKKIVAKLRDFVYPQLKEQPFFGKNIKKLRNYTPETWRYRVGNYRFFYEIDEKENIVYMIAAEHRSEAY